MQSPRATDEVKVSPKQPTANDSSFRPKANHTFTRCEM